MTNEGLIKSFCSFFLCKWNIFKNPTSKYVCRLKLRRKCRVKKKLIVLGVLVLVLVAAIGCTSNKSDDGGEKEVNVSVSEIAEKIQSDVEWPALIDLDEQGLKDFYGIDASDLEEYDVKIPMMIVKSNEIAVIKVKDAEKVEEVKENVEKRAESIKKTFETYLPDQYENAKNYLLKVEGKYIIFAVHEDTAKVEEVLNNFFK